MYMYVYIYIYMYIYNSNNDKLNKTIVKTMCCLVIFMLFLCTGLLSLHMLLFISLFVVRMLHVFVCYIYCFRGAGSCCA